MESRHVLELGRHRNGRNSHGRGRRRFETPVIHPIETEIEVRKPAPGLQIHRDLRLGRQAIQSVAGREKQRSARQKREKARAEQRLITGWMG